MSKFLIIFLSTFLTLNAQVNHSLSFDGVDDYVDLENNVINEPVSQFSMLSRWKTNKYNPSLEFEDSQYIYYQGGEYKDFSLS